MRPINRCLNPQLVKLCQRVIQLDELNLKIQSYLPKHLAKHCQVGSFNQGCLLITVSDAVWATELRYSQSELRDNLRKGGLFQLTSIKIAIIEQLPLNKLAKKPRKQKLSSFARESILTSSALFDYHPLKKALSQLAEDENS